MKKIFAFFILSFCSLNLISQQWVDKMLDPKSNFYDVQKEFNTYWSTHDNTEKGKGYKQFKRWEHYMEQRVYPSGNLTLPSQNMQNFEAFLQAYSTQKTSNPNLIASSTWTAVGPMGPMAGTAGGQLLKSGRINFITIHPAGSNTLFVGAPAGGLWKSTNGGTSWTTNTDLLQVIGCSDLVIDPTNPNIMYLATGDGDAGDTYSIGVLKSIDGGITWAATGMVWTVNQGRVIRKLIIDPTNTQVIIAATNIGIWRTANGGTTWTQVYATSTHDLEFMPGNTNTVYAGGATFRISTNNGVTWTQVSAGIPTTGVDRMAVAVTPANPNYVYVIAGLSSNSGFQGFYRSTNSATSFSTMATTPNLLGWSSTGSDTGGQSWYDLCCAASPLNQDEVVVGGVNVWRTTNGGSAWSIYGHWTGSGAPFTHADQHDLEFDAAGTLFNTNDGTVYRRSGATWTEISGTMNISQIYKIGTSALTANFWLTGHQDNGTSWWNGTTYQARMGGDGMDCWIDRTNNNNMFASYYSGQFQRSTNGGASWSTPGGFSGTGNWVSPWKQDPVTSTVAWAARSQMFRSTNSGANFTATTGSMTGTSTIVEFAVAPTNNQIVYVIKGTTLWKTTDQGATWTNITGTVPTGSGAPTFITVSPTDANKLWVTLSGYSAGNKVFMSTNGGTTWTNYTSNLPNLPANCSVYQVGTNDLVYVGMDVGVYYRDNTMGTWTLYNSGLPNMPVFDMEISPANPTKLVAASFGRGVWMVDVISSAPPASSFSVAAVGLCAGQNVAFTDQSTNAPTSWTWTVSPSAGVTVTTPTLQNPTMNFTAGGTYTITLTASNGAGPGAPTSQTITIGATPTINISSASQTVCAGSPVTFTASGGTTYTWTSGGGTGASATYTPTSPTTYTVTGTTAGCSSNAIANVAVNALPTVSITGSNAICMGSSVNLTGTGALSYVWSTSATTTSISVSPTLTTAYTTTGTAANGCKNVFTKTITVNALPTINTSSSSSVVCAGSNASLIASGASTYTWMPGSLSGATVTATPTLNTTYTVTGTDVNGCTNTSVRSVTVNALPSVTATASSANICAGQSTTLTGSGAASYTWMPGSITGNPIAPSPTGNITYTLIGLGSNGCVGQTVRSITVNPSPTVTISSASQTICLGSSVTYSASGASTYSWTGGATTSAVSYTPSGSTTYTVLGTSGVCSATALASVIANPNPTVIVSNASQTVCVGSPVTFNASGATTYSWTGGATTSAATYTPSSSTTYTVRGTSGSCSSTTIVSVTTNSVPVVSASASGTLICSGNSVVLNGSGASTYTWNPGSAVGSTVTFTPSSTTTYTVIGSSGAGCNSTSAVSVSVSACTGINQVVSNESNYFVYPNPTSGKVTINTTSDISKQVTAEVVDAIGKVVQKHIINFNSSSKSHDLNITELATGMYFIRLTPKDGKSELIKIIKD